MSFVTFSRQKSTEEDEKMCLAPWGLVQRLKIMIVTSFKHLSRTALMVLELPFFFKYAVVQPGRKYFYPRTHQTFQHKRRQNFSLSNRCLWPWYSVWTEDSSRRVMGPSIITVTSTYRRGKWLHGIIVNYFSQEYACELGTKSGSLVWKPDLYKYCELWTRSQQFGDNNFDAGTASMIWERRNFGSRKFWTIDCSLFLIKLRNFNFYIK